MKTSVKSKLKRIRMELDVLISDLNELENFGFDSEHVLTSLYYLNLVKNELRNDVINEDIDSRPVK